MIFKICGLKNKESLHCCEKNNVDKMQWEKIDCQKIPNNFKNFIESIRNNNNIQPDFKQGAKIQKII